LTDPASYDTITFMMSAEDDLFEFPCRFPIKAMGAASDDFELLVVGIVRRHAPDLGEAAVSTRPSRNGRFLSVTCVIQAQSRAQLDEIYRELSAHPAVKMAL